MISTQEFVGQFGKDLLEQSLQEFEELGKEQKLHMNAAVENATDKITVYFKLAQGGQISKGELLGLVRDQRDIIMGEAMLMQAVAKAHLLDGAVRVTGIAIKIAMAALV